MDFIPNSTASFDFKFSPGKVLHSMIFFTILFPFIPSIIPTTDTQPTFFLLFLLSLLYVLINPGIQRNYYHLSYIKIFSLFSLVGLILTSVLIARLHIDQPTLWTRIISFLQFVSAIFFAYNTKYFLKGNHLKTTLVIFAIFSIVFFLTHGMIERILIPARTDSFELMQKTGRGARTLSPEPSFFALHILNIYIIYCLVASAEFKKRNGAIVFWFASFCLLISLSGYGFVIFIMLMILRYRKLSLFFFAILLVSSGFVIKYLETLQGFRAFKLLANILANDPSILLKDRSFAGRFGSFTTYLQNIKENVLLGDGFTLFQGGGFISVISSLGILAVGFFIYFLYRLLKKNISGKLKIMLIFWFLLNFFSGPIGIATLGVIIGLVLRRDLRLLTGDYSLNSKLGSAIK